MAGNQTVHIQTRSGENVRIGPISIITLIVVLCMAVLAVLAASTSYASTTISERQAQATKMLYDNELAGQELVACIDDALYEVRRAGGSQLDGVRAVRQSLDLSCEKARSMSTDHTITCTAQMDGTDVVAEFVCDDTRRLELRISIREDVTYRIEKWKATSVQQTPQAAGTLWLGE